MDEKGHHSTEYGFAADMMVRAALVQTEVCEAMQEVKRHWGRDGVDQEALKNKIAEECADSAIRCYDLAWMAEVDLDVSHTLERPAHRSRNLRHALLIRLGKINSLVSQVFDAFEGCCDMADDEDQDGEGFYFDSENGRAEEVQFGLVTALHHLDDFCRVLGRNLNREIETKMAVNMQRPIRYGTPDEGKAVSPSAQQLAAWYREHEAAIRSIGLDPATTPSWQVEHTLKANGLPTTYAEWAEKKSEGK